MPNALQDPEGYTAAAIECIERDPVLKLFLRSRDLEEGCTMLGEGQQPIAMDKNERDTLLEVEEGLSNAVRMSNTAMEIALDLHAVHHFTAAAAVDGSRCKRKRHPRAKGR